MNFNPFDLTGKTIVVTGASSGIGRQCAIDCSRMGARVILIGRNEERLQETDSLLSGCGHQTLTADLNDNVHLISLLIKCIKEGCPIDGFIHSAGIERTLLLRNLKPSDYLEIYNTNFVSGVEILKLISKKGNFNPGCKIVFLSSITALIARIGTLAYTASKGALISATRELAIELAPKGININCISPGTVLTPMMEKLLNEMNDEDRAKRLDGFPLGIGKPEDISSACIFLLSDAARWITGQNIVIDGGYTIR